MKKKNMNWKKNTAKQIKLKKTMKTTSIFYHYNSKKKKKPESVVPLRFCLSLHASQFCFVCCFRVLINQLFKC